MSGTTKNNVRLPFFLASPKKKENLIFDLAAGEIPLLINRRAIGDEATGRPFTHVADFYRSDQAQYRLTPDDAPLFPAPSHDGQQCGDDPLTVTVAKELFREACWGAGMPARRLYAFRRGAAVVWERRFRHEATARMLAHGLAKDTAAAYYRDMTKILFDDATDLREQQAAEGAYNDMLLAVCAPATMALALEARKRDAEGPGGDDHEQKKKKKPLVATDQSALNEALEKEGTESEQAFRQWKEYACQMNDLGFLRPLGHDTEAMRSYTPEQMRGLSIVDDPGCPPEIKRKVALARDCLAR